MADDSKVWVDNQKIVERIHQKLKAKISEFAKAKSWSIEKSQAFEKSLLELYKDVIEESVKSNVSVNGKEWVDETKETQTTQQEPFNEERLKEVNGMWSSLEDLAREATNKRKTCPPIVTGAMNNILQSKLQLLEAYSPAVKFGSVQCTGEDDSQDGNESILRLQEVVEEQAKLALVFPEIHTKAEGLQQAILTHQGMEASETDAVLFSNNNSATPSSSRRSTRTIRTPQRYIQTKISQSGKKPSLKDSLLAKNHSHKKN